jgi:hypothetical protein
MFILFKVVTEQNTFLESVVDAYAVYEEGNGHDT